MKKLLLVGAATCWLGMPGLALAADMPIATKAPMLPPIFSWTGCYLGAHVGGGWARKDVIDPVQLVQDTQLGRRRRGRRVGLDHEGQHDRRAPVQWR
jgi:outer membrane immunogenic protein